MLPARRVILRRTLEGEGITALVRYDPTKESNEESQNRVDDGWRGRKDVLIRQVFYYIVT